MSSHPIPRVAVAIPCYNEAAAIGSVIREWREALPEAEILVFDNNSTDDSATTAAANGARVVAVPNQGKGWVVQKIFEELRDRPAVVMVDGDGTYPAANIDALIQPVLEGSVDMSVGARQPDPAAGAMSPVRGLGNVLIRSAFRLLIGRGPGDLLSGYRVFSPNFMRDVELRSSGFEIETELACEAAARRLRVLEVPVGYRPRIEGTSSKLRAWRDGCRILRMIVRQSARLTPWRLVVIGLGLAAGAWLVSWLALGAAGFRRS